MQKDIKSIDATWGSFLRWYIKNLFFLSFHFFFNTKLFFFSLLPITRQRWNTATAAGICNTYTVLDTTAASYSATSFRSFLAGNIQAREPQVAIGNVRRRELSSLCIPCIRDKYYTWGKDQDGRAYTRHLRSDESHEKTKTCRVSGE